MTTEVPTTSAEFLKQYLDIAFKGATVAITEKEIDGAPNIWRVSVESRGRNLGVNCSEEILAQAPKLERLLEHAIIRDWCRAE